MLQPRSREGNDLMNAYVAGRTDVRRGIGS